MKMKAMGLNGLQTYVAWNLHEPERGVYNWEGMGDLTRFLEICQKHDMLVFLRPGPYICAEWDLGGIPYWVLSNKNIKIRSSDPLWEKEVEAWFNVLLEKVKPYLYSNGGPVAMVQIENEYGSYSACDLDYLRWILHLNERILGKDVIYYTTDGAGEGYLKCGTIEEVYSVVDFGVTGDVASAFAPMRKYQPTGPLMNSEFYPGWLSHWNEGWPSVDTKGVVSTLKAMLEYNASVNFYMAYGGTNFGFYSGANGGGTDVQFDTTSYDYDAPISEAGDTTQKYVAIREYLQSYLKTELPSVPANSTKKSYGEIKMQKSAKLFDNLETITRHYLYNDEALLFEELGNAYGYVLYRINSNSSESKTLEVAEVMDRIQVFVNGKLKGIITRKDAASTKIDLGSESGTIDLLVENQGRINFGGSMTDRKGIIGVKINGKSVSGFEMLTLPMDSLDGLVWKNEIISEGPCFYYGTFNVDEVADTWFDYSGWHKGHIYINGFNLGRHWEVGPPMTLYVPSPVLRKGLNEVIIFEQDSISESHSVESIDHPIIIN